MASIGEILAEARRKQGKSIKDVEKATKIRSRYIEALENNQFDRIPGDVYVKGFIRSYTQYLSLDPEPLIKQYDVEYLPPHHYEIHPPQHETSITPRLATTVPTRRVPSRSFIFSAIVGSVLIIFIGLIVWGASLGGKEKPKTPQPQPKKEIPATKVTTPTPTPTSTPTPVPEEEAKPGHLTIKVKITEEKCWLRVIADDEKVYEGTLTEGEVKEWTAKKEIFIRTGNAKAATVWKNGVKIGTLGTSGGIAEETFTLD